jgi:hypothetical protein
MPSFNPIPEHPPWPEDMEEALSVQDEKLRRMAAGPAMQDTQNRQENANHSMGCTVCGSRHYVVATLRISNLIDSHKAIRAGSSTTKRTCPKAERKLEMLLTAPQAVIIRAALIRRSKRRGIAAEDPKIAWPFPIGWSLGIIKTVMAIGRSAQR